MVGSSKIGNAGTPMLGRNDRFPLASWCHWVGRSVIGSTKSTHELVSLVIRFLPCGRGPTAFRHRAQLASCTASAPTAECGAAQGLLRHRAWLLVGASVRHGASA